VVEQVAQLGILSQRTMGEETDPPKSQFDKLKLLNEFYTALYKQDDHNAAIKILEDIGRCVSDKYQAAIVTDSSGELMLHGYRKTRDMDLARKAEDLFLKALEFKTEHDEVILWHLGVLMQEQGDFNRAIKYINQVLEMKPKEPLPYLATALMLAVDVGHWDQAKKLVDILLNIKRDYYFRAPLLLATVRTLCHYNGHEIARQFVADVKRYQTDLRSEEKKMLVTAEMIADSRIT